MRFLDRADAGRQLAARLADLRLADPVILALPRGGVPVAHEICRQLNAPLDLVMVRKIGAPGNEELAAGAVVDGDAQELVLNEDVVELFGISEQYLQGEKARQLAEIERRRRRYLGDRPRVSIAGRTVVVVDDGIATGATVRAALRAVRKMGPKQVVFAVPVADAEVLGSLEGEADRVVCVHVPKHLGAVGMSYRNFEQMEDEEVIRLMAVNPARAA
ncbi:phosphoribosyltransferase [Hyaloraphidium curvatum]|nr:phosphoribosyltransferase [Hyaloraphidium curvatum]